MENLTLPPMSATVMVLTDRSQELKSNLRDTFYKTLEHHISDVDATHLADVTSLMSQFKPLVESADPTLDRSQARSLCQNLAKYFAGDQDDDDPGRLTSEACARALGPLCSSDQLTDVDLTS